MKKQETQDKTVKGEKKKAEKMNNQKEIKKVPEEIGKRIQLRPLVTEKAVMLVETQNTLKFRADKNTSKTEIKKEIETLFNVKIEKIRTLLKDNRKHVYVKLKKEFPAIDIATKLGVI